jgi:flagellar hook-length control protein FliK
MMLGVMSQQIPQANAPISITPQKIDTTESSIQGLNGSTKVKNNAPTTQTISSPLATNINSSKVDAEAESNKNSFAQFTKFENPVELTSEKISKLVSELKSSPNQEKSLAVLEKLNPTSQATQTTDNVLASSMPVNKITNTDTNNHSLLNQENGKDASLNTSLLSPTQTITNGQVFNEQMKVVSQNSNVSTTQNLPTQFNSPDWGPALSQRVTWMVRDQLQNASITINPPHLGPIEVRLQTDATAKTTVQFFSNHAEVRQAITDQLPTLRHMMSDSGLQLGQADVSSGGGFNQQTSSSPGNPKRSRSEFILPSTISADSSQGIGLINTYA